MSRDYESVSSIETFLSCPRAYYLSYVAGLPAKVGPAVDYGKWIHKQLEAYGRGEARHQDAEPFIEALKSFLEKEKLKIKQVEVEFKVHIQGQTFKGVIDAICDREVALDRKSDESTEEVEDVDDIPF